MVKTISKKPVKKMTKTCVCKSCGFKLSYVRKDVKSHALYSMCEYDGTVYSIKCSKCGASVSVPKPR